LLTGVRSKIGGRLDQSKNTVKRWKKSYRTGHGKRAIARWGYQEAVADLPPLEPQLRLAVSDLETASGTHAAAHDGQGGVVDAEAGQEVCGDLGQVCAGVKECNDWRAERSDPVLEVDKRGVDAWPDCDPDMADADRAG
jgi:hypothetical protein